MKLGYPAVTNAVQRRRLLVAAIVTGVTAVIVSAQSPESASFAGDNLVHRKGHGTASAARRVNTLDIRFSSEATGESYLTMLGTHQPGQPIGKYDAVGRIYRVPCQGRYDFVAHGDDPTGSPPLHSTYEATVDIIRLRTSAADRRCGRPLPPGAGRDSVRLVLREEEKVLFDIFPARRDRGSRFVGTLQLRGQPSCGARDRLRARFTNGARKRIYRYSLSLVAATSDGQDTAGC